MSLSRAGHEVTIFERDFYDYTDSGNMDKWDKSKTYPIDIGAKGLRAIRYLGIEPFF